MTIYEGMTKLKEKLATIPEEVIQQSKMLTKAQEVMADEDPNSLTVEQANQPANFLLKALVNAVINL